MTLEQLLIDFDLKLNSVSSFTFESFTPEEKVWFLNQATLTYIKEKLAPVLGDVQTTLSLIDEMDIETLAETKLLPLKEEGQFEFACTLPSDLLHLINGGQLVVGANVNYDATVRTSIPRKVFKLLLLEDNTSTPFNPFKIKFLNGANVTVAEYDSATSFTGNIASDIFNEMRYELIDDVLHSPLTGYANIYWEKYESLYYPNCFLFVTPSSEVVNVKSYYDNTNTVVETAVSLPVIPYYEIGTTATKYLEVSNRVVQSSMYDEKNPFMRTTIESPLCKLEKGKLIIRHDKKFTANAVKLRYYRRPVPISIPFKRSFEIGANPAQRNDIGRKIVDIAVTTVSGILNSPTYQANQISQNSK